MYNPSWEAHKSTSFSQKKQQAPYKKHFVRVYQQKIFLVINKNFLISKPDVWFIKFKLRSLNSLTLQRHKNASTLALTKHIFGLNKVKKRLLLVENASF